MVPLIYDAGPEPGIPPPPPPRVTRTGQARASQPSYRTRKQGSRDGTELPTVHHNNGGPGGGRRQSSQGEFGKVKANRLAARWRGERGDIPALYNISITIPYRRVYMTRRGRHTLGT